MTIGERIKQRRIELGLSQEELAHRMGNKTRASVSTVEHDKEDLTTDRIRKYAEALETTPAYLMGWDIVETTFGVDYAFKRPERDEDKEKAAELWAKYLLAPPNIQKAIDNLLKGE